MQLSTIFHISLYRYHISRELTTNHIIPGCLGQNMMHTLQWRHNERDCVSEHQLCVVFIFDRCRRSSAAVAPVKYKCYLNNLGGTFARSKILLTEKLTNRALVTATPGTEWASDDLHCGLARVLQRQLFVYQSENKDSSIRLNVRKILTKKTCWHTQGVPQLYAYTDFIWIQMILLALRDWVYE